MDINLIKHRFYKVLHMSHYYEGRYGIKVYNKVSFRLTGPVDEIILDPSEIMLGFDGLKDPYTLLGIYISASPHLALMKAIETGESLDENEYIIREKGGYLDGRYELRPNYDMHIKHYKEAKNKIESGTYEPPIIYQVGQSYYAFDGKHRLALCYMMGVKCKCKVMLTNEFCSDAHTIFLLNEMKKRQNYKRNIAFLSRIID